MTWKIIITISLLSLVMILVACTQATATPNTVSSGNPSTTGAPLDIQAPPPALPQPPKEEAPKLVKVDDILSNPDTYKGQTVIVEGKILSECGAGCWFTLNDGSGTIYVDLAPSNLVIPQRRGYKARVLARVTEDKGNTYLIGEKVEF